MMETVLLLHSSGSSARQWQGLADSLRPDFRVLAVEFHGHGAMPDWRHAEPMALADDAAIAVPLLKAAGGAHVVGHSYGAAVAMKLAAEHPRLVHSLAGYEPVAFRLLFDQAGRSREATEVRVAVDAMRDCVAHGDSAAAARIFVEFWSGPGAWQALPAHRQDGVAVRMRSVMRHFDALFGEAFARRALAESGTPMLYLCGARTVPTARRIAQLLRTALPGAHHQELAGMGHMGPVTHPAQVNHRICQFLRAQVLARTPQCPKRAAAIEEFLNRTFP